MLNFPLWKKLLIFGILLTGALGALPNAFPEDKVASNDWPGFLPSGQINLGLDLQGGSHVVLEVDMDAALERAGDLSDQELLERKRAILESSMAVIRQRVDGFGIAESTVQAQGDSRVLVQVPGIDDPRELMCRIGQTAQLTFHEVIGFDPTPVVRKRDEDNCRLGA